MILQVLSDIGPWVWFILGFLLLAGEVAAPGVFLMWFGLSGLVIGTLTFVLFPNADWWNWQVQVVMFGLVSLLFVIIGNRLFPSNRTDDDASDINQPLAKQVGREATMMGPMENGAGRVRLGDTVWRVRGSEVPDGARVLVVDQDGGVLIVEPV